MHRRFDLRDMWLLVTGVILAGPCLTAPLFDDAFIHARIIENLLSRGEPYFNHGDGLKVDSATGYLLLLAPLTLLFGNAVAAVRALQSVTVTFLPWCFARVLSQSAVLRGGAGSLMLAVVLPPLLWSAYGVLPSHVEAAHALVLAPPG